MRSIKVTGKGRRWVLGGHPWIYVDDVFEGQAEPGELVPVLDPNDNPLGWGLFSSHSRIAVRLVSRAPEQPKRAFWAGLVGRALAARDRAGLLREPRGACRLLAGDADGVPGFVADRYADVLVLQSSTQGSDRMRDFLVELLLEALPFPPAAILDRSDASVRRLEGLETRIEWLRGAPRDSVVVEEEGGLSYEVDVLGGHKTGHYLDQRHNRVRAARFAAGRTVLDAFSYDGLFGIRAALAGAESVVCLDQSAASGERLLRNAERNGVADRVRFEKCNAMLDLRRREREGERYGLVIADPPAFARNRRELVGAERGYRELNRRALRLVESGGELVTASCSYNVSVPVFEQYLALAALDSERDVYLDAMYGAGPDHPHDLAIPETRYLKCAFLRVEDRVPPE